MNYRRHFNRVSWASIALALVISGCGKGITGGTAATVGDATISKTEYYSYLEQKGTMLVNYQGQVFNAPLDGTPAFQAIKDLVINQIILKIAKDEGVSPTENDAQAELTFQEVDTPNLMQEAISRGYSPDMLLDEVKVNLAKYRILTKGVTVTDTEVDQFIKDHPDQFMKPPVIDSSMIIVDSTQKKNEVDSSLSKGESFHAVAANFSIQPDGNHLQFKFPIQDPSKMPAPVANLLNATSVGHSTAWVHAQEGWVKFFINTKTPATPMVIDAHLKEKVRRALMQEKGMSAADFNNRVKNELIKDKDNIKIDQKAAEAEWKQFISQLANNTSAVVPNSSAGGTGSPSSTGSAPAAPGSASPAGGFSKGATPATTGH